MTSQWTWWRFKSPASLLFTQPFVQSQIKESTKALRHWPLCAGNSPVTGEFPAQRASNTENVSIWWRHHPPLSLLLVSCLLRLMLHLFRPINNHPEVPLHNRLYLHKQKLYILVYTDRHFLCLHSEIQCSNPITRVIFLQKSYKSVS